MRLGWHGEGHIASVDVSGSPIRFHTKGAFEHTLGTFDRSGRLLSLLRGDATTLPEVGCAAITSRDVKVAMKTELNRALLDEIELAKPQEKWITSKDGTKVHLWVMRPPRAAKKKVPAVLEIHGGPHGQYGVPFFHEFQVLAAAGYAVFYPNPRGSKGYGRDHCAAIRGCWGTADWHDVEAVIETMQQQDWVDTRRMGIMGGSYGGYMTNWAIGHTDVFAAAITDRCVSNWVSMWGNSDFPGTPDRYWRGNAWDRPEALWESSPMKHLGNARTPTAATSSNPSRSSPS